MVAPLSTPPSPRPHPEQVLELQLTPEDNALIIGSDGLWDVRQQGQTRRPGSGRAGHLRLGAPSRSRTAALWASEQSYRTTWAV